LARKHAPQAYERIVALLDSDDDRVALAAARELLDRAYGKPKQGVDMEHSGQMRIAVLTAVPASPECQDDAAASIPGESGGDDA